MRDQEAHDPVSSLSATAAGILEQTPEGLELRVLVDRLRAARIEFSFARSEDVAAVLSRLPHIFICAGEIWQLRSAAQQIRLSSELEGAPDSSQTPVSAAAATHPGFVVFDVEATDTNAETAHLLQIAAVALDETLEEVERFGETLVQCEVPIPEAVSLLTGIDARAASMGEPVDVVLRRFIAFCGDRWLVAHNGTGFDGPLLARLAAEIGVEFPSERTVDSLAAASVVLPREANRTMEALRELFEIEAGAAHRAGADVNALVEVLRRLRARAQSFPPELRATLGFLLAPSSGTSQLLGLKAAPLDNTERRVLEIVQARSTLHAPLADRTPVGGHSQTDPAEVQAMFAAGGPLARASQRMSKTFEPRAGQAHMAEAVRDGFDSNRLSLIEAGTGTGKTRAYLIPSIASCTAGGGPVAIATHTRALQDQLMDDLRFLDQQVPELKRRRPWSYALLKGRGNYLCLYKLAERLREVGPSSPELLRLALGMLVVWAWEADEGTADEYSLGWVVAQDGAEAARAAAYAAQCDDECAERHCPFYNDCYYFSALRRSERADLTVVNHALLLSSRRLIERVNQVVVDEAHDLESAATDALTLEVSGLEIARTLGAIHRSEGQGSTGWRIRTSRAFGLSLREGEPAALARTVASAQAGLEVVSTAIHHYLHEYDHKRADELRYPHVYAYAARATTRPWLRLNAAAEELSKQLRQVAVAIDAVLGTVGSAPLVDSRYFAAGLLSEGRSLAARLRIQADLLDDALRLADRHNRVYLLEAEAIPNLSPAELEAIRKKPTWAFRAPPIDVGPALGAELFSQVDACVLTSATLTVDNSFAFTRRRLGLARFAGRLNELQVASPFDYQRQALLALPGHLPAPRPSVPDEYLERLAQEMARYLRTFDGHTLGLFTARTHLERVTSMLLKPLADDGLGLLVQRGAASVPGLVRAFKRDSRALLAGLRTFWQGIDVPGADLQHVWMTKLPYPNMGDPLLSARQQRLLDDDPDANTFEDFLLPLTVLLFKQGFGRLIRTGSDRGAVVVADRRLRSSMYRDTFLRSLPGPAISEASDVAMYHDIAQFLGFQLEQSQIGELPPTEVDTLLAEWALDGTESRAEAGRKLSGALAIFQLSPPPITSFRAKQLDIMLDALQGDTLGLLPTGSGKSLTFQLPALLERKVTLVVSPLVALMKDQVDKLRRERGIQKARAIVHTVSRAEQEEIMQDVESGRCKLLYLAPERLRDQQTVSWLADVGVARVVVDEAHCVSLWGPSFRPEFLAIREVVQRLGQPPVLALTATATATVRREIEERLGLDLQGRIHTTSFDRPNLRFAVRALPSKKAKDRELVRIVSSLPQGSSIIVYVARKKEAERLSWLIETACGVTARPYHAGMSGPQRSSTQEAFIENGEQLPVVVCTNAFGMGVDKPDVRAVIHYDMPGSLEAYYQEAGRAGRDGELAYCVLLYTPADRGIQDFFIRQNAPEPERVRMLYARILSGQSSGRASRRRQTREPLVRAGAHIYLNPDAVAQDDDITSTTLRVILHHLEERGYLLRSPFDYGTRARLKLRRPIRDALNAPDIDQNSRALLERLADALDLHGADDVEFDTLALAQGLDVSPVELEAVLLRLNRQELLIYRSWERGMVLEVSPDALPADQFAEDLFENQRQAARDRLEQMRRYAAGRNCRRATLLLYLGDNWPRQSCDGCDACVADYPWPWAETSVPDIPLDGGIDITWEILRAVAWADGRFARRALELALRGNEYYGNPGSFRLNSSLLAADFFGRAQYTPRRRFDAAVSDLLERGLVTEVERTWSFAAGTPRTGRMLVLTELGQQAFAARRVEAAAADGQERAA